MIMLESAVAYQLVTKTTVANHASLCVLIGSGGPFSFCNSTRLAVSGEG